MREDCHPFVCPSSDLDTRCLSWIGQVSSSRGSFKNLPVRRRAKQTIETMQSIMHTLMLALCLLVGIASAHNIQMKAHTRECFHETLHADDKMTVSFQVGDREFSGSGNLEIDFWVCLPLANAGRAVPRCENQAAWLSTVLSPLQRRGIQDAQGFNGGPRTTKSNIHEEYHPANDNRTHRYPTRTTPTSSSSAPSPRATTPSRRGATASTRTALVTRRGVPTPKRSLSTCTALSTCPRRRHLRILLRRRCDT